MQNPSFADLVRVFSRIGLLSFGGPAGQIALMHKELVEDRGWIGDEPFLRALNFCHLLPGPEAQQLATYIGWRLHGVRGGLAAGGLFVLPGALVMLALSFIYISAAGLGWFAAIFLGVKAAVLALVVQALIRIAKRALNTAFKRALALAAFLLLFLFALPFPIIVLGAGAIGIAVAATRPDWLKLTTHGGGSDAATGGRTAPAVFMLALAWLLPFALIALLLGRDHALFQIATFFSKLALVSFGGAYAVLAYMAQEAVQTWHWLRPGEMADGLGLAETTPGPLVMVTQFVGFLGAYRAPAPFSPLVAGTLGALVTTWVTFVPCFLWIFAFAPWIERLEHARRLQGGLAAITAAIVGVIANLALWFALHLLFRDVAPISVGPLHADLPLWQSVDLTAVALSALAFVLLFRGRLGVPTTLGICSAAALAIAWAIGTG